MSKKRRIEPIAVDDDAEPDVATLPVPAFSAQPTDSTRIVDPPEEGRRIWVSLDEGYDFNYKKMLQSKGLKLTSRAKDAVGSQVMPGMPSMPGFSTPIAEGKQGEQGNQMQKAMRRIERRVQREHMVAVTGNAEADSDEDMDEPDAEAADGDVAQLDEDGKDDNDKEDGEEEQEYQQSKGPKNQYDLNDDFIDDSEFIEAIQMRDERKLKHQGFFVNSGAVERIGDKVPIVAAARARNKKKRALAAEGDDQAANPPKTPSKATKNAKKEAVKASASDDNAPPLKAARTEDATVATASTGLSLVQMAMQAGATAAAGGQQPDTREAQPAAPAALIAASPAQVQGDATQSPNLVPITGHEVLSDKPPMFLGQAAMMSTPLAASGQPSAGAAPSPSAATHATPDGSASVQMEAHAARMRSLPLDAGPDMLVGLQDWSVAPRFREVLAEMREVAANCAPPCTSSTKKKMPQELSACLEALVRPFYISAAAAPNANKAKRAMWSLMMPLLTPWSAENTIKTKMQKVNTQILGAYQLEKNKLEGIAQWTASVGLHEGLNAARTMAIVRTFVDATSACDAIPLTAENAGEVWEAVAEVWNNAGGPMLNGDLIATLYRRALEVPESELPKDEPVIAAPETSVPETAS